ncbi:MAG: hypothetical protein COV44_09835 [Deltaproteobacteria bacterium CG11_big_fil_rev_8_21_14_0_20_45_16]|nr:MAG: hypothetical protein COV44_09835 [Deltaproteobacteria bacterium CG11_big_fil_rev_8_21_14_0_20_45_16]
MTLSFPHTRNLDPLLLDRMSALECRDLGEKIADFIRPERREMIESIIDRRCLSVRLALEDIYDAGNLFAVLRSAEVLGFQNIDLMDNHTIKKKIPNRAARRAEKWLSVREWKSTEEYLEEMKRRGFKVYTTSLDTDRSIEDLDFSLPSVVLLGNEKEGTSSEARRISDGVFKIPMRGFTQSFNISVAAAVVLYHIRRSREQLGLFPELSTDDRLYLRCLFYLRSYEQSHHWVEIPKA